MFFSTLLRRFALPALVLASLALIIFSIAQRAGAWPVYWERSVVADFAIWSVIGLGIAYILKRTLHQYAAHGLTAAVGMYLLAGTGIANAVAVGFFMFSSLVAGRLILALVFGPSPGRMLLDASLMVGLALQLAVFSILVHYPVNGQALYFVLLAAPLLVLLRPGVLGACRRGLADQARAVSRRLAQLPFWSFAVSLIVLGHLCRYTFFPTAGYDDNAQHLRMWTELATSGQFSFDVVSQIGAVVPFAIDLLHAIVSVLAGADARGALNLALAVLLLRQVWLLSGRLLTHDLDRMLLLVLFASTPMLAHLLTTLQTELFLALLTTTGVKLALENEKTIWNSNTAALLAVAAMACATKLPGAVLGLAVLLAWSARLTRARWRAAPASSTRWVAAAVFLLMLAVEAFNAYVVAWRTTGNPVFPFYNAIFHSPFFENNNFSDLRYVKGFSFTSYWRLFFNTSEHHEGFDYTAGFQFLLLLPLALLVLFMQLPRRDALVLTIPVAGFGLVMFSQSQYWRYLFPVLPLASVVLGSLLAGVQDGRSNKASRLAVRAALAAYVVMNVYFLPGISWFFTIPASKAFTEAGRQKITEDLAPVQVLNDYLNQNASGTTVLYDYDVPYGASLAGRPVYVNWYSPARNAQMNSWQTSQDLAAFLKRESIGYVMWRLAPAESLQLPRRLLREHLSMFGTPERQAGAWMVYRLRDTPAIYQPAFSLNALPEPQTGAAGGSADPLPTLPLVASAQSRVLGVVKTNGAGAARYQASFQCSSSSGYFIAQINWNVAPVYYRLVPCEAGKVQFSESVVIPVGATSGVVYLSMRGDTQAVVSHFEIGTN